VIDDHVIGGQGRNGVDITAAHAGLAEITRTDTHMLNNHVVTADNEAATDQRDARRWCRLARNCHVRIADRDFPALKINHAADFEHDDPWSICLKGCA